MVAARLRFASKGFPSSPQAFLMIGENARVDRIHEEVYRALRIGNRDLGRRSTDGL